MKFIISLFLIAILSFASGLFLPWWNIAIVAFLVIAFVLFMIIKGITATKKKEVVAPAAPVAPPAQEVLLAEIRDLLKAQKSQK